MLDRTISFKNHDDGFKVAKALLDADYVVMLSYEEEFLVVNYEWSEMGANRGDVVFMTREEFEWNYYEIEHDEEKGNSYD